MTDSFDNRNSTFAIRLIPAPLPPNLNPRWVLSRQAMLPDDGAAAEEFRFANGELRTPAPESNEGQVPLNEFDTRNSHFDIPRFFSFNHAAGSPDSIQSSHFVIRNSLGPASTNGTIETDPASTFRYRGNLGRDEIRHARGLWLVSA